MFGYILTYEPELKVRELVRYRSYYCGLCRALKKQAGIGGQLTLSYDLTFLALLLTALYEPETKEQEIRCAVHPGRKHLSRSNAASDYAAKMNLVLTYHKCRDDWTDEKKLLRGAQGLLLRQNLRKICREYPGKVKRIAARMRDLRACEVCGETNPDLPAGLFGDILGTVFAWKEDIWADDLYRIGFYLGKYIYLLDAYEDREADKKSGNYNIFLLREDLDAQELLTMMMAECARSFERLPIVDVEEANILRNILYVGVWKQYGHGSLRGTGRKAGCHGRRNKESLS